MSFHPHQQSPPYNAAWIPAKQQQQQQQQPQPQPQPQQHQQHQQQQPPMTPQPGYYDSHIQRPEGNGGPWMFPENPQHQPVFHRPSYGEDQHYYSPSQQNSFETSAQNYRPPFPTQRPYAETGSRPQYDPHTQLGQLESQISNVSLSEPLHVKFSVRPSGYSGMNAQPPHQNGAFGAHNSQFSRPPSGAVSFSVPETSSDYSANSGFPYSGYHPDLQNSSRPPQMGVQVPVQQLQSTNGLPLTQHPSGPTLAPVSNRPPGYPSDPARPHSSFHQSTQNDPRPPHMNAPFPEQQLQAPHGSPPTQYPSGPTPALVSNRPPGYPSGPARPHPGFHQSTQNGSRPPHMNTPFPSQQLQSTHDFPSSQHPSRPTPVSNRPPGYPSGPARPHSGVQQDMAVGAHHSTFENPMLAHQSQAAQNGSYVQPSPGTHPDPILNGPSSYLSNVPRPPFNLNGGPQNGFAPPIMNQPAPSLSTYSGQSCLNVSPSFINTVYSINSGKSGFVAYISLEIRAIGLKNKDKLSLSDPICILQIPASRTLKVDNNTKWKSIDKTEVQRNTLSPSWTKQFRLPYLFEEYQPLRFWIVDNDGRKLEKGDFVGMCVLALADIVRNPNYTASLADKNGKAGNFGKLIVRAFDENANGRVKLDLRLSGKGLRNVERVGKSDPFFRLSYTLPGGGSTGILKTSNTLKNNLNPQWDNVSAVIPTAGHSWETVDLKISVFDENKILQHKLIGECQVSLANLIKSKMLPLTVPQKKRSKPSGTLSIEMAKANEIPRFVSYIQGGLQLKFSVAVDFTASNKNATLPESLHYQGDPNCLSVYGRALWAVGTVVSSYLHDDTITALGFGAKLPGSDKTSFDFALSGEKDPHVLGVDGLLTAYSMAVRNVTFSGPTNFEPLIRHAINNCQANPVSQDNQYFTVLLILTDGVISDMRETIDAIIDASYSSPLSIVILGVGDSDFTRMELLDSDDKKLVSADGQHTAKCDIVQFIKYDDSISLEKLAAEVLHEVPERLVRFMMDANIKPADFSHRETTDVA